jgi:hypothetical protein
VTDLALPRAQVEARLVERIELGQELLDHPIQGDASYKSVSHDRTIWHRYNTQLLLKLFTDELPSQEYAHGGPPVYFQRTLHQHIQELRSDIERHQGRLRSLLSRLELFDAPETKTPVSSRREPAERGEAVFIVHGSGGYEHEVWRAISEMGAATPPIILQEQFHVGASLLERLERESEKCGFAVVIYSGDDMGFPKGEEGKISLRARDNVVLELGYFLGLLGRTNVSVLYEPGVLFPSDFGGIGYYELDKAGAWKAQIEGELRRAGLIT